jgi:hypothetical protein
MHRVNPEATQAPLHFNFATDVIDEREPNVERA